MGKNANFFIFCKNEIKLRKSIQKIPYFLKYFQKDVIRMITYTQRNSFNYKTTFLFNSKLECGDRNLQ